MARQRDRKRAKDQSPADTEHPPSKPESLHSDPGPLTPRPCLVSACLAGLRTRHDGRAKTDSRIVEMVRRGEAIPICPEQLGGLPTPREEASFADDAHTRVKTRSGKDVTRQFKRGAEEVARLAQAVGAREAILKEGSPSCGTHWVYQHQPGGAEKRVPGEGATAQRLRELGVRLRNENELSEG